jgi:hypothetical protein
MSEKISTLNPQHSNVNTVQTTLNSQHSTLNTQHSTLNPQQEVSTKLAVVEAEYRTFKAVSNGKSSAELAVNS